MATHPTYPDVRAMSDEQLLARLEELGRDGAGAMPQGQLELHELDRRQAERQADETRGVADAVRLLAVWVAVLAAIGLMRVLVAVADALTR
jgi:hypothetical protein